MAVHPQKSAGDLRSTQMPIRSDVDPVDVTPRVLTALDSLSRIGAAINRLSLRDGADLGPDATDSVEAAPFTATDSFRMFWISFQDTVICAQNIVTAADSEGLGSVYVGLVLECFIELREMFGQEITHIGNRMTDGRSIDGGNEVGRKLFGDHVVKQGQELPVCPIRSRSRPSR